MSMVVIVFMLVVMVVVMVMVMVVVVIMVMVVVVIMVMVLFIVMVVIMVMFIVVVMTVVIITEFPANHSHALRNPICIKHHQGFQRYVIQHVNFTGRVVTYNNSAWCKCKGWSGARFI